MKKGISLLLVFAIMLGVFPIVRTYADNTLNMIGYFGSNMASQPVYDGLVSANTAEVTDGVSLGEFKVTSVVPLPQNGSSSPVALSHSSLRKAEISLEDVKYIRYYYYYGSKSSPQNVTYDGKAMLKIPKSDFNLTQDITVYSFEELVPGKWNYLTFDVGTAANGAVFSNGVLPAFEFYPFGDTASKDLSVNDEISLLQLFILGSSASSVNTAIANGTLKPQVPIYFVPGRSDCEGAMDSIFAQIGETITLPECGYNREGYTFNGWICSKGSAVYASGAEYTVSSKVHFVANWKINTENALTPEYYTVNYADYWGGLVKPAAQSYQYNYATVSKNYDFNGINTLKLQFHPSASEANRLVQLDGSTWSKLPFDISKIKYLAIPYYYKTERSSSPARYPVIKLLTGNTKALKTSVAISEEHTRKLETNTWAFMTFKFDFVNDSSLSSKLNPDSGTTIVNQFHIYPFGDDGNTASSSCGYASKLAEGDELYLGNFLFMTEIPSVSPTVHASFVSGYDDGTFRPSNVLTNAEAAVLIAKAIGFVSDPEIAAEYAGKYSDISESEYDWCRPYIEFLEKENILRPQDGEKFRPSENAERTAFLAKLLYAKSGDTSTTHYGTEIPDGNTAVVTRAQAVNSIFSILRDTVNTQSLFKNVQASFSDVTQAQWYYNDIMLASKTTVKYTDADGNDKYLNSFYNLDTETNGVTAEQLAEGDAYLLELDTLTNKRIQEIRNTQSAYSAKKGGKIYYVSSSEGSSSGGSSEDNPLLISVLNEVSDLSLSPGDVVLFKRGDTFRGSVNAKPGVTYSAYGDGNKPLLTRSPENGSGSSKWTLDYTNEETGAKIWKYYDESYVDVGAINLIDANGNHTVAYKEVPSYIQGKYWVRGRKPGENEYAADGIEFNYINELDRNLEFFHRADSEISLYSHAKIGTETAPNINTATGPIYLRCDEGNPGSLYPEIEFNLRNNCIAVSTGVNDVTVDNLCIKYFGSHGIGAGTTNNLTVTNCEIGWGGGSIQNYQTSANYSNPGQVVRFGNGVEIYGGLNNYTIDNCYVYQIYDAGITHQVSAHSNGNYYMGNVRYTNNVLTHCIYNIEYFMSKNNIVSADGTIPEYERFMNNVYFGGNICRMAGYGWGVQRPDGNVPSNVKGWNHHNLSNNYVIENNIFDRTVDFKGNGDDYALGTGSSFESSTPYYKNNIIVQVPGRTLIANGLKSYKCNSDAEQVFESFGGVGNKVYFVTDDKSEYSDKVIW